MNLKEAFRYQNYLETLIRSTCGYIGVKTNVMKTTQEHQKNKANPEAKTELIDTTSERSISTPVNDIIRFLMMVTDEKVKLGNAISKAKASCGTDIDNAIATNKTKQYVSAALSNIGGIRSTERVREGKGYKFNAEGNQTTYTYDIKEVSVIDFDRNEVKRIVRNLLKDTDDVSSRVDKLMVDVEVIYNPPYDVNDSFEDALDQFIVGNTK
jgi:tRNA U55 pseudouridine synthase TruB